MMGGAQVESPLQHCLDCCTTWLEETSLLMKMHISNRLLMCPENTLDTRKSTPMEDNLTNNTYGCKALHKLINIHRQNKLYSRMCNNNFIDNTKKMPIIQKISHFKEML